MYSCKKCLKKVEKFQAPAAFYRPSDRKGGGWLETALEGGTARILQHHYKNGCVVNIVRWTNFMKKDGLNCRILEGLPLKRGEKNRNEFFFKSSSSTSSGRQLRTVFALRFSTNEDADDFQMWWLALNGSIKDWLRRDSEDKEKISQDSKRQPLRDSTNSKRKAPYLSPFGPEKKKPKINLKLESETTASKREDSTSEEELDSDSDHDDEQVVVDDYNPQSQCWMDAFEFE